MNLEISLLNPSNGKPLSTAFVHENLPLLLELKVTPLLAYSDTLKYNTCNAHLSLILSPTEEDTVPHANECSMFKPCELIQDSTAAEYHAINNLQQVFFNVHYEEKVLFRRISHANILICNLKTMLPLNSSGHYIITANVNIIESVSLSDNLPITVLQCPRVYCKIIHSYNQFFENIIICNYSGAILEIENVSINDKFGEPSLTRDFCFVLQNSKTGQVIDILEAEQKSSMLFEINQSTKANIFQLVAKTCHLRPICKIQYLKHGSQISNTSFYKLPDLKFVFPKLLLQASLASTSTVRIYQKFIVRFHIYNYLADFTSLILNWSPPDPYYNGAICINPKVDCGQFPAREIRQMEMTFMAYTAGVYELCKWVKLTLQFPKSAIDTGKKFISDSLLTSNLQKTSEVYISANDVLKGELKVIVID